MASYRVIGLLAALIGCACTPEQAESPRYSPVFDYMHKKSLRGERFSQDESQALYAGMLAGKAQLYSIGTGATASAVEMPLPPGKLTAYSYFPRSPRALIGIQGPAPSGDKLYALPLASEMVDLTPGKSAKVEFYEWRADARGFFYGSNRDAREFMYLY